MDDATVLDALSSEVARRVPAWYGAGAVASHPVAIETRRFSFFLRFPVVGSSGESPHVLVKVPRLPEMTSIAVAALKPRSLGAIREYRALVAIHDWITNTAHGAFRAVRPLGFLEPWNAFAMEETEGRSLKQLVGRWQVLTGGRAEWDLLERAYHQAGVWLAAFHDRLGGARDEPPDKPQLRVAAAGTLAALERASSGETDTARLRDAILDRIEGLGTSGDRVAVLHRDFMSHNILMGADGRIAVIDTQRDVSGSVYEDVARLATDLSTLRLQVLAHGAAYRAGSVRRCVGALLRGYFGDREPDAALLGIHCSLAVAHKWSFDEERLAASRGLPRPAKQALAAWVRRFLRRRFLECIAR